MVRPSPPISAATFAPTANSPPGQDFTRPTHSMPLNRRRLGPLTTPHMYLGMVDSKGLDLDDDVTCLGFRLRDVLVDQAVQPAELLENDGTHSDSPIAWRPRPTDGAWARRVTQSAGKKVADRRRDFRGMRLEREVSGVEEAHDRVGNIPLEGLRAGRQEERVVLAPHRQKWRLVVAKILLEGRVKRDVAL